MIKLGSKVRDTISGIQGVAIARTEWLYGCARIVVQPQETKYGKPVDSSCFDETQLEVLEAETKWSRAYEEAVEGETQRQEQRTGGPQNDAVATGR